MKVIKDISLIDQEYCNKLSDWIIEHQEEYFSKENEADSWHDFDFFPNKKTDRKHLVMSGEVCIIDRMWKGRHAYVVCQFYSKCKKVRDLYKVIYIDNLDRNYWRNGYFLIPDLRNLNNV